MNAREVAAAITEGLVAAADPTRAVREQAYLKSTRPFLGCGVPAIRRVVASELRAADRRCGVPSTADQRRDLIRLLWADERYECRKAAVDVAVASTRVLGPEDLHELGEMIRHAETWALVDELAVKAVGPIVASNAAATSATLDEWNEDPDSFWVRRAAMLCLLDPLRTGGDWCRFVRYATSNLDDGEFFIRKAIGWVLREVSKRRPELVAEFVDQHGSQMSGVTMREATKYLPRSVSGPSGT